MITKARLSTRRGAQAYAYVSFGLFGGYKCNCHHVGFSCAARTQIPPIRVGRDALKLTDRQKVFAQALVSP